MGWSIGWDSNWKRDIGYGVPAICDHPKCNEQIDRGLGYVCGAMPYGGDKGCGLFFCGKHQVGGWQRCPKCYHRHRDRPYKAKPDTPEWIRWKLNHVSWAEWRDEHPSDVIRMRASLTVDAEHG